MLNVSAPIAKGIALDVNALPAEQQIALVRRTTAPSFVLAIAAVPASVRPVADEKPGNEIVWAKAGRQGAAIRSR